MSSSEKPSGSWWSLSFHQILSTCISLVGFVFVIITISKNTETMERTLFYEMSKLSYDTDKLFLEHPDLRPYFYDSLDIYEGDSLYSRALSVAELQLDFFDTFFYMDYLKKGVHGNEGWIGWVENSFKYSPILRRTLVDNIEWYPDLNNYYKKWKSTQPASSLLP